MAGLLFSFYDRCPGAAGLPAVPALTGAPLLSNCNIPPPLQQVYVCPAFDLPAPPPFIKRALYVRVTAGPVAGSYSWQEVAPDGSGGLSIGPLFGTAGTPTGATEVNDLTITPGPTVYPGTLIGGTGSAAVIAGLSGSGGGGGGGGSVPIQLTSYDPASQTYGWQQVGIGGGGLGGGGIGQSGWTPTGNSGAVAISMNGFPAPADGFTVYMASFTPNPPATATATISGGAVTTISLTASGWGYATAPNVTISGGGGTGATATAALFSGTSEVYSVTVTSHGSGYTSAPTVSIDPPPPAAIFTPSGGGGVIAKTGLAIPPSAGPTAPGHALVEIYYLSSLNGNLVDSGIAAMMYNMDPVDQVEAGVYVQGKFVGGALIHDYELCTPGS